MRFSAFVASFFCVFVALIKGGPACAGAFMQSEGDWLVISTSRFTGTSRAFDANGKIIPVSTYSKFEFETYIEYGATNWLTLIAKPTSARIFADGAPWGYWLGFTSFEAGARVKLMQYQDVIVSAQAIAHMSTVRDRANPALVGNTGHEFDLRLLAGVPFEVAGFHGFADAQLAYRFRRDGPPNEIRFDLTLGFRPFNSFLLMAQSFNTFAPSSGAPGFPRMRQHKIQASAVWDLGRFSIQSGVFTTVSARRARLERGIVTAIWYRF